MSARAPLDRLLAAAVAASALLFAWTLVEAVRLDATDREPHENAAPTARTAGGAPAAGPAAADSGVAGRRDLAAAIVRNPFSAARSAPRVPYRLASSEAPETSIPFDASTAELPVLLGTAVGGPGASFAMCSYQGAPASVVRVGDAIGPYTVVAIARGRVTVRDAAGARLELVTDDEPPGDQP
jgi:hypothetical protein